MTKFESIKLMSIDELAMFIVKQSREIELARDGLKELGVNPDVWFVWVDVMKRELSEEVE